jgi:hypothetical protein
MKQKDILHYPNLKTVLEVEDIIKQSELPLTRYKIIKKLKNKIMKQTLNVVIDYLDNRGVIYDSKKGIIWTYQPKKELKERIMKGLEV